MTTSPPNALLVFLKYPEPGKVKTRLARGIGDPAAAEVYSRLAEHTVSTVSGDGAWRTIVCFDPAGKRDAVTAWLGRYAAEFEPQGSGDLGERMKSALTAAFSRGHARAVIIGTDCPGITRTIIRASFDAAGTGKAVLGPAKDGGYYLIGLSRRDPLPPVFEDIEWGTDGVYAQTVSRLASSAIETVMLPVLADLDTAEDLRALPPALAALIGIERYSGGA